MFTNPYRHTIKNKTKKKKKPGKYKHTNPNWISIFLTVLNFAYHLIILTKNAYFMFSLAVVNLSNHVHLFLWQSITSLGWSYWLVAILPLPPECWHYSCLPPTPFCFFWEKVSLCSLGCSRTCYIETQTSACSCLNGRIRICTTTNSKTRVLLAESGWSEIPFTTTRRRGFQFQK